MNSRNKTEFDFDSLCLLSEEGQSSSISFRSSRDELAPCRKAEKSNDSLKRSVIKWLSIEQYALQEAEAEAESLSLPTAQKNMISRDQVIQKEEPDVCAVPRILIPKLKPPML